MDLRIFCNQFTRHQGNVIGCGQMSVNIQSATVDEGGVFHAEFFCPLVHSCNEFLFRACNVFCHCHAGIIRTCHGDTFDHGVHILGFSGF